MSGAVEGVDETVAQAAYEPGYEFFRNKWIGDHIEMCADLVRCFVPRDIRTTPPARSYDDEDVARIIDPNAWAQREHALMRKEHWERNPIEGMPDFVAIYAADAEQLVAPSLAKAAAIRLLSQGGKA